MLPYTLKLILILTLLLGLAYLLNVGMIGTGKGLERQRDDYRYLNHQYHQLKYPELVRYGEKK